MSNLVAFPSRPLHCDSFVSRCIIADMALDLALTLVYLEDLRSQVENKPELRERCRDAFNLMLGLGPDEKKAKLRFTMIEDLQLVE